jgi:hypothetical protein
MPMRYLNRGSDAEALQHLACDEHKLQVAAREGVADQLDAALPVLARRRPARSEDVLNVEELGAQRRCSA